MFCVVCVCIYYIYILLLFQCYEDNVYIIIIIIICLHMPLSFTGRFRRPSHLWWEFRRHCFMGNRLCSSILSWCVHKSQELQPLDRLDHHLWKLKYMFSRMWEELRKGCNLTVNPTSSTDPFKWINPEVYRVTCIFWTFKVKQLN